MFATGPRFALPRETPYHVIGYKSPPSTLIKSSGAKNCRVSIPVCKPYTLTPRDKMCWSSLEG